MKKHANEKVCMLFFCVDKLRYELVIFRAIMLTVAVVRQPASEERGI